MPRPAAILVPILIAATVAASIVAWHEHRQLEAQAPVIDKAALFESENDQLGDELAAAQRQALEAENAPRRAQIEQDVSAIRQLPFKEQVVYESLDRAGIRQVVSGKLSEVYTDQEIEDMSTAYSALGLLPPHFPLKQTYINLLGEQIAAFYDQHQHKLFMFQDASLENAQNRVILAHELTHALQDQNFGLLRLPLEVKNNDDQAAAASALIEGDATLVMAQYMQKDLTWRTMTDTVMYSATQSMEQIRKAPRFLREMLVFPYIHGQQFCQAAFERGGYAALTAVYANPPASTAQILHPEKYFAESREDPIPVSIPDTTFQGRKPIADNVLGEMGCRLLFEQFTDEDSAEETAAGWRGDRYLVFDQGDSLVWRTIWNSPAAAAAAASVLAGICEARFHVTAAKSGEGYAFSGATDHFPGIEFAGANEVVLTVATNQKSADLLREKFAGASHG
jgi:hypothetical protein